MNIEQFNADHGIVGQIEFFEGQGGLPFIRASNAKANALISVYAGQVLAYRPAGKADDLMFLSEKAYYQAGKAIKGGVPICWPWFGSDPEGKGRPAHGFVRNRMWDVIDTAVSVNGEARIVLGLTDTPETRSIWPHAFVLRLEITIGETLGLALITRNSGDQPFSITQAFHTYFGVGDIHQTSVSGLEGKSYIDKVDGGQQKIQSGAVTINTEVDRIYLDVANELVIHDAARKRNVRITSQGSRSAVIWNPWAKIASEMADLQDDDYLRLLCVETTNAASDVVTIQPGSEFRLTAQYRSE
ncbi:glucose-6-phosphate 1-epimerase [Nitrosomonas nitrosa]|uniref:Putative glucose-6-phosphate 1-epimerase n=1 Tax=Nitrosomonas nitrosa TaxID=52442 RepID=A0A1I4LC70_9PROT|nr:D-hexose-6-phosphate mutarotase [Nitrosomonas nitrosa]MCO6432913.1 D-hexose-6-phosphate mutarotase [Nitrosomonas nitrosa]PTR04821.1 glucose-6-phosphate 1-epimerase [Nitrosomonas nitrosa]CAE6486642.1 Glucose-6-phosphate 1-epimerase [Nitrosomonas nitrosa]SFL88227.1 glucose-6-phosphate 1-epimerase [Nitrosomonas nitrosa]